MADIERELVQHSLIALDTSIFIYHFEGHPRYLPLTRHVLGAVESGSCRAVTSTVTVMELTVQAWRLDREDVARQYEVLLTNFPHLKLIDVSRHVARRAAQLRAQYNLRPADALQVATAFSQQATLWVTNDKALKRLEPEIAVMVLDDFAEG